MAPTHVNILEVFSFHEPSPPPKAKIMREAFGVRPACRRFDTCEKAGASSPHSKRCRAFTRPLRFMAPTHVNILEVFFFHEPLRSPQGAKQCAKRLECVRLAGALARAKKREQARRTPNAAAPLHVLSGSWPQHTSTFWRCSLSMNRDLPRGAKWCAPAFGVRPACQAERSGDPALA